MAFEHILGEGAGWAEGRRGQGGVMVFCLQPPFEDDTAMLVMCLSFFVYSLARRVRASVLVPSPVCVCL